MKKSTMADLSLLLVAIIWGSGFIFTKNALDHIGPFYLLFYRFLIGSSALGLIMYKRLKKATKKDLTSGLIIGLFLFGGFAFQTVGLQYTEAGKQAFITASYVVLVPFIYWVISKVKPDKFELVAAFLCLVGIGILSLNRDFSMNIGDLLTLISAVLYAFHIAVTGHFSKDADPIVISVLQLAVAGGLSLVFALVFEKGGASISRESVVPILYLAIFSSLLAFLIQTVAQKYTSSSHAALILSLESVFGSVLAIIFLKEALTLKFFIGCVAILISVITAETKWEFLRPKKL